MNTKSWTLACVFFALQPAWAVEAPPEPAPAGAPAGKVKSLTDRMRGVMHDVTTLTYAGEAKTHMPDGKRMAVSKTKVTAERIENGGWKLLVDGTFGYESGEAKKPESPIAIRAAYDGAVVSTLQEKRKAVRKGSPQDFDGVRLEMNQGDAATTVCWELLSNPPFPALDRPEKVEAEEPEKVGDQPCDVLWVVPARSGANPPVPFRLFLATSDGLPRKVEQYRPAVARQPKDKRGDPTVVLTLADIVGTPDPAANVVFEVETPKGFIVTGDRDLRKPAESPKPSPAPKPADQPAPTDQPKANSPDQASYKFPLAYSNSDMIPPGSPAPEFKLKDAAGTEFTLSQFKGSVVILDFCAAWSPDCKVSMPAIQRVRDKYADKGVVVVGLDYAHSAKSDIEKFKKDLSVSYPVLLKGDTVQGAFRVKNWPSFYVIGKDGKVVWADNGLRTPPTGSSTNDSTPKSDYLISNLSQAVDKALVPADHK